MRLSRDCCPNPSKMIIHADNSLLKAAVMAGLVAVLCLAGLMFSGCGYAKHKDPDLYRESSPAAAQEAARLHARDIAGDYHQNKCCGSMEPLIYAGDWIVTKREVFTDALLGKAGVYRRENGQHLLHRFVSGNARDGYIASGDNNARSEPDERVTSANYISTAVAIYGVAPDQ